jgi:AsmA protein
MPDPACQVGLETSSGYRAAACAAVARWNWAPKPAAWTRKAWAKSPPKMAGNKLSEKLEEKLGDKVSPELKDALKGLFNR